MKNVTGVQIGPADVTGGYVWMFGFDDVCLVWCGDIW